MSTVNVCSEYIGVRHWAQWRIGWVPSYEVLRVVGHANNVVWFQSLKTKVRIGIYPFEFEKLGIRPFVLKGGKQ